MSAISRSIVGLLAAVLLTACGEESGDASGDGNAAPKISGTPATSAEVGEIYTFAPAATDSDGDALLFGIDGKPDWLDFDTVTGALSGTPSELDIGTHRGIVIWVSDGASESVLPAFDLSVRVEIPNRAPLISGTPSTSVAVGRSYDFMPAASDADGDDLVFSVLGLPEWADFDAGTGRILGTPGDAELGTYSNIVLSVSDGELEAVLPAFDITVLPAGSNSAPSITGAPATSIAVGQAYAFTPAAADADGDTLTFALVNGPAWAEFSEETGALTGTPEAEDTGTHEEIIISVTDGVDTASLPPFSIEVTPIESNTPPEISGTPPASAQEGVLYSFRPTALDLDGDALTFSISNRPTWATFSQSTGRLRGTPGAAHVRRYDGIVIRVSDGRTTASLPSFSITVEPAPNGAPTISGTPATTVTAGNAYSFQPTASDPDGDSLTYSIMNRPSWAVFSQSTGRLSGTPSGSHVGSYAGITISVSDGTETVTLPAFTVTVAAANGAPVISGSPATSVTAGSAYSFQPTASDPNGDTLTFSIQNRPGWATFNQSTGRLSGTPTQASIGSYGSIVISVSDGTTSAALPAFAIAVTSAPNGAPTISGTPATSVVAGTAYTFQPSASDPNSDGLTFTIQNRPSWASFNSATGRLSGTPSTGDVGTYGNIIIGVTDGQATAALAAFSITVEAVAMGSVTLSWTAPTQFEDGRPLNGALAGYKLYWGTSSGNYTQSVTVSNAGVTTYVIENLAPGTYYFSSTAYTEGGLESRRSNEAVKVVQ